MRTRTDNYATAAALIACIAVLSCEVSTSRPRRANPGARAPSLPAICGNPTISATGATASYRGTSNPVPRSSAQLEGAPEASGAADSLIWVLHESC